MKWEKVPKSIKKYQGVQRSKINYQKIQKKNFKKRRRKKRKMCSGKVKER